MVHRQVYSVGLEQRLQRPTDQREGARMDTKTENFYARLGAGLENDGFQSAGQRFDVPKKSILFTSLPLSEHTCYLRF